MSPAYKIIVTVSRRPILLRIDEIVSDHNVQGSKENIYSDGMIQVEYSFESQADWWRATSAIRVRFRSEKEWVGTIAAISPDPANDGSTWDYDHGMERKVESE